MFGTLSSAQTLSRMINYFVANKFLGWLGPGAPFQLGAVCAVLALFTALGLARVIRQNSSGSPGEKSAGVPQGESV